MPTTSNKDQRCLVCGKETASYCSRCKNVYFCSRDCQKKGWKSHKSECVEFALPDLPTSACGDADKGDDAFEILQHYMQIAADTGNRGNRVRESILLRRVLKVDARQPCAYYNLANACTDLGNVPGALESLAKASVLLLQSDIQSSVYQPEDETLVAEQVVFKSIHVVGRAVRGRTTDFLLELRLMENAVKLASRFDDKSLLSDALLETGNIFRKLGNAELAITTLKKADECLQPSNDRHLGALEIVPLILAGQAVSAETREERDKFLAESIREARRAVEAATQLKDEENIFYMNIIVAKMIMNELGMKQKDDDHQSNSNENEEKFLELQSLYISADKAAKRLNSPRLTAACNEVRQHLDPV
mmetsp:Transcript_19204/g.41729  ORF Transcript_19204/g.41729 Transcript_19204/m.41729 type:complete len:362 (+) Transcript_19204:52-1137(+)